MRIALDVAQRAAGDTAAPAAVRAVRHLGFHVALTLLSGLFFYGGLILVVEASADLGYVLIAIAMVIHLTNVWWWASVALDL